MKHSLIAVGFLGATLLALAGVNSDDSSPVIISAFNAGELSPLLKGRADFPKFDQGCETLENMLPLTQGPVMRRPGTKYIATAKTGNTKIRLIPFEYSTTDAYVLEFGDLYMRVYRNGGQVLDVNDDPYEIVTPFAADELDGLQYAQSANTMYFVDANDEPQALTRDAHTDWDINDVNFTTGPFLERDTSGITIEPNATTGTITLTASAPLFNANQVGALWKIYHHRADTTVKGVLDANEAGSAIAISGEYNAVTHGTWTATLTLERSYDAGATWDAITAIASTNDNNLNTSGTEDDADATYRLEMTDRTSGSATYTISALTYLDYGIVRVTGFVDPCEVNAVVVDDLVSTSATSIWQEGYWSPYRGWPRSIEFHEQRLWFGGSTSYPQTLWASQTAEAEGDYENMTAGTEADSALIFKLPGKNPIQWLFSQTYLVVGTAGGVGRIGSPDSATTPTNVEYRMQTKSAAEYIQPAAIGDVLLYIERGGRKMRQYLYSMDVDQFIAPDISILSEHVTTGGLTSVALQMNPEPILWCTRADGQLVTVTYLKEQDVTAWARQLTDEGDGEVQSVCVIPGSLEDEVWWAVTRPIDDTNDAVYIEQVQPQEWGTDQNDCWFVDSGLMFDGGSAQTVTAATKATPCKITVSTWPTDNNGGADANLADGDQVIFQSVGGMTQLNGNVYTVDDANITDKTFTLDDSAGVGDINSTAFTTYTSGGTVQRVENTFGGLDHLEDRVVAVWGDGQTRETVTVDANTATLEVWLNRCTIGLPYTSTVRTMPLIMRQAPGSPVGPTKKLLNASVDFYETYGAEVGDDAARMVSPEWEDTGSDAAPELYSGWKEIRNLQGGWVHDPAIVIEQTNPAPMTVRQLTATLRSNR